ncbi:BREX system P-loop protein BrxC [Namhaeicola litoreus]|uniref:BREX system P-loop protein BrxC n=1 Tax=Namhaeicola litoreus TaxID=1052145 RepID=A0ABW3Y0T6_9FLAO
MNKMLLKEIFDRDIYRDINPAVVVSDYKDATINAEIKEYVFTDELIEKLFLIIDTVLNKKAGKTGIWINGYYGSGKSHFIKYVHYLLNKDTSELAFAALEKGIRNYDTMKPGANDKITLSNLKLLQKRITASHCDDIMFNVEDETDDGSQERLTRIFLNMFNKFRGYNPDDIPLAILLEKTLDQKGLFQEFKDKISSELGFDWEIDAADVAGFQLSDVLDIAKSVYPSLDIVSLHNKLTNPDSFKIGINATLIPELKAFLKEKDQDYRLLFLVDEVSQYVGSNKEILLNFQNIIERVSQECNNQVWIACTAQQTLEDVSKGADGVTDIQDEFGKILGRFDTRISLQSNDASYITQRRVLDKNSEGIEELTDLYNNNKDYIENQFKISHELYKGYQKEEEFLIAYPFVPYQFKLIAHVFEAFQQLQFVIREVKDNERSVLGITHFTIKQHGHEEVGGFIPFDAFYNQQFHTNLTNRGMKAVQNGLELSYVQTNPFAQRVVKVLFLVSNLLESQRQTFPSSIENLAVLLMDKLDQNRMQLQKDIKEVLDKLIEESIIREEKGSYFFFNEDEIDVQNLIKSQTVGLDDRWKTFDELLRPLIKVTPKFTFGQNDFKIGYGIEAKEIFRNGDFDLTVLLTDHTPIHQKALDSNKKELVVCVNEWFNDYDILRKEFDWYCKTNKYFLNNGGGAGERSKTNENFRIRNNQLKQSIESRIKNKFPETRFISQNTVLEADSIHGSNPAERINNLIDLHLSGLYKNHKLCLDYARNQSELKKSASDNQVLNPILTPAEVLVNDFITSHNNQMTVNDLIKNFEKEPFGWRFEAVLDILINLVKKKKREFAYKGQQRYPIIDFINKAVSTTERMSCEVITGEDIDPAVLDNVVRAYNHIFNENLRSSTDGNEQFDILVNALHKHKSKYDLLETDFYGTYPFGISFHKAVNQLNEWLGIRDPKKLFSDLIDGQIKNKELFDLAKGMEDFAQNRQKEYDRIKKFEEVNKENFNELGEEDRNKVAKMRDFLKATDPRKEFRHIMKAFEELETALKNQIADLQKKVIKLYHTVFDELESEAQKRKVAPSVFVDRDYFINGIKNAFSVNNLKTKELNVNNFKAAELAKIISATQTADGNKAAEAETYYVSTKVSTISNEQELDAYLNKVRHEMLEIIHNNKIIILK